MKAILLIATLLVSSVSYADQWIYGVTMCGTDNTTVYTESCKVVTPDVPDGTSYGYAEFVAHENNANVDDVVIDRLELSWVNKRNRVTIYYKRKKSIKVEY